MTDAFEKNDLTFLRQVIRDLRALRRCRAERAAAEKNTTVRKRACLPPRYAAAADMPPGVRCTLISTEPLYTTRIEAANDKR